MITEPLIRSRERRHRGGWRVWGSCLALLCTAGAAIAQESWETALKLQLEAEKKCELAAIISVRQIPIAGLNALEGRIRCTDDREFDFSRARPHQKFTIQLCQPAVC